MNETKILLQQFDMSSSIIASWLLWLLWVWCYGYIDFGFGGHGWDELWVLFAYVLCVYGYFSQMKFPLRTVRLLSSMNSSME